MPLLRISALHKYYGDHHVLKGIDLSVEEGQVVAIIGRSGSGKSTLLRTLNGLESINDGVIEVDGEYLDAARADLRSLRQKVGMVFQQFNLFPHLTVGENVMLAPQVVQKVPEGQRPSWRADVGAGRAGREIRCVPGSTVRRTATTGSDCPGAGNVAESLAVR